MCQPVSDSIMSSKFAPIFQKSQWSSAGLFLSVLRCHSSPQFISADNLIPSSGAHFGTSTRFISNSLKVIVLVMRRWQNSETWGEVAGELLRERRSGEAFILCFLLFASDLSTMAVILWPLGELASVILAEGGCGAKEMSLWPNLQSVTCLWLFGCWNWTFSQF